MASDDRSDFDLSSLLTAPATAMAGFMGLADGARKAVTGILDTIASLQRAAAALEQLSARITSLLDDVEAPVRALTPEFERAMARFQRVADAFDGPIDRLLPGLENAVDTFDRVALSQLPENMDQLRNQVVTIVEAFSEFPRRMVGLAQLVPGLERLASFRPVPPRPAAQTVKPVVATPKSAPKSAAKSAPTSASKPAAKPKQNPIGKAAPKAAKKPAANAKAPVPSARAKVSTASAKAANRKPAGKTSGRTAGKR